MTSKDRKISFVINIKDFPRMVVNDLTPNYSDLLKVSLLCTLSKAWELDVPKCTPKIGLILPADGLIRKFIKQSFFKYLYILYIFMYRLIYK